MICQDIKPYGNRSTTVITKINMIIQIIFVLDMIRKFHSKIGLRSTRNKKLRPWFKLGQTNGLAALVLNSISKDKHMKKWPKILSLTMLLLMVCLNSIIWQRRTRSLPKIRLMISNTKPVNAMIWYQMAEHGRKLISSGSKSISKFYSS